MGYAGESLVESSFEQSPTGWTSVESCTLSNNPWIRAEPDPLSGALFRRRAARLDNALMTLARILGTTPSQLLRTPPPDPRDILRVMGTA